MTEKTTPAPEKVTDESAAPAKQQGAKPAKADRPGADKIERRPVTVL